MSTNILKLSLLTIFFIGACKKSNSDYRDKFTGNYELKGPVKYVLDGYGRYEEENGGIDTASLSIEKPASADSNDFILLRGVSFQIGTGPAFAGAYFLKFVQNGIPVAAQVNDTSLTIPEQFPYQGSGMSISGTGTISNKKLTIQYKTHYRGLYKYATVTSQ